MLNIITLLEIQDAKVEIQSMKEDVKVLPHQEEDQTHDRSSSSMCISLASLHKDGMQVVPYQVVGDVCPRVAHTLLEGVDEEEANRQVRRSLFVSSKFTKHLQYDLEYLRGFHCVRVFLDPAKGKMHIKGAKKNSLACFTEVSALLAQLRGCEAAAP